MAWPGRELFGFNDYHPNGYDAIWAAALALNASIEPLSRQVRKFHLKYIFNNSIAHHFSGFSVKINYKWKPLVTKKSCFAQILVEGNLTRPKRLDDFNYTEEPEMTDLFLDQLAKLRFHGVSVSISFHD